MTYHDNRTMADVDAWQQARIEALQRRVAELEEYIAILEAPEVYGQDWRETMEPVVEKMR